MTFFFFNRHHHRHRQDLPLSWATQYTHLLSEGILPFLLWSRRKLSVSSSRLVRHTLYMPRSYLARWTKSTKWSNLRNLGEISYSAKVFYTWEGLTAREGTGCPPIPTVASGPRRDPTRTAHWRSNRSISVWDTGQGSEETRTSKHYRFTWPSFAFPHPSAPLSATFTRSNRPFFKL